jgi:tRNA nucleotidyltransferase/poly(A) polymerase
MEYRAICDKLTDKGFEVYLVGGYVRDYLLDKIPSDADLVTNAKPEEIAEIFKDCKLSYVGTNFKVSIVDGIEVATYRKDVYNSIGLDRVEYAESIEEDLARRDLTINAIAMHPYTHEFIDPFNGRHDLKGRKIKFVGDPEKRIKEDPLRIVRACRFLAVIDGIFDRNTFYAMQRECYLLSDIPKERIMIEIIKAMKAEKASKFFNALKNINYLNEYFYSLSNCIGLEGGKYHGETVYEHSMMTGDFLETDDPIFKLAGYLHDIGKAEAYNFNCDGSFYKHDKFGQDSIDHELTNLKFSNEDINFIKDCIQFHMYDIDSCMYSDHRIKKFLYKIEARRFSNRYTYEHFLDLFEADHKANLKKDNMLEMGLYYSRFKHVINKKEPMSVKDLVVDGNDVMEVLNIKPGPRIKEVLNSLLEIILEKPEFNTREFLIEVIRGY